MHSPVYFHSVYRVVLMQFSKEDGGLWDKNGAHFVDKYWFLRPVWLIVKNGASFVDEYCPPSRLIDCVISSIPIQPSWSHITQMIHKSCCPTCNHHPQGRGPRHHQRGRSNCILSWNDKPKWQKQPKFHNGQLPLWSIGIHHPSALCGLVCNGQIPWDKEVRFLPSNCDIQQGIQQRRRQPMGLRGLGTPN